MPGGRRSSQIGVSPVARALTCDDSNTVRASLTPLSSITNYIGGRVLNADLPAHTATTWGLPDGTEVLRDVYDERGCRHLLLTETVGGEPRG